jgi:hypothetical protein
MQYRILVAALAVVLGSATAYAETPQVSHASNVAQQSNTADQSPVPIPQQPVTIATVRIPRPVTADDQALKPGTYQVRLLGNPLKPVAGETPGVEQWVEFLQNGRVKGKAVASVVPQDEIRQMAANDRIPASGRSRVDVLKGNDYVRVWINREGTSYLIHLPTAIS